MEGSGVYNEENAARRAEAVALADRERRKDRVTNAVATIFSCGGPEKWNTNQDLDDLVALAINLESKVNKAIDAQ